MDRVIVVNQRSVVWGVFWGMTFFFIVWCVVAPVAVLLLVRDVPSSISRSFNQGLPPAAADREYLVKPGYIGQFKCWAAKYRSDIDSYVSLALMLQDRAVDQMRESRQVIYFDGEAEVLEIDYADHFISGGPLVRVHYAKIRPKAGEYAGQLLWGYVDLNDPDKSSKR